MKNNRFAFPSLRPAFGLAGILAFGSLSSLQAGMDSGGGMTTVGSLKNHASIGEPVATPPATNGQSIGLRPGLIEVLYASNIAHDDFDADGMPDAWEKINNLADPQGDADGDGQANQNEFVAGTNPNSSTSVFRMEDARKVGSNWEFNLPTMNGREYKIGCCPQFVGKIDTDDPKNVGEHRKGLRLVNRSIS